MKTAVRELRSDELSARFPAFAGHGKSCVLKLESGGEVFASRESFDSEHLCQEIALIRELCANSPADAYTLLSELAKRMRERGFDLGGEQSSEARLEAIYAHARHALYATLDDHVIRDACPVHVRVRTAAVDREDYLAHPPSGERIREDDGTTLRRLYPAQRPQVQLVISDGLNANAGNEGLRALIRYYTREAGVRTLEREIAKVARKALRRILEGKVESAEITEDNLGVKRPGDGVAPIEYWHYLGKTAQRDYAANEALDP